MIERFVQSKMMWVTWHQLKTHSVVRVTASLFHGFSKAEFVSKKL